MASGAIPRWHWKWAVPSFALVQPLTEMLGVTTSFTEAIGSGPSHVSVVWHLNCSDRCNVRLPKSPAVSDTNSGLWACLFAPWQLITQHLPVRCPTKCSAAVMGRWKDFQASFKEKDVTNCLAGSQDADPARWGSSHERAAKGKGEDTDETGTGGWWGTGSWER